MIEKPIVNVINLPHRDLRLQQFHEQSLEQEFEYKVWPGIVFPHDRKKGIYAAHSQIVRYAKEENLPYVLIAEDDCRFFAKNAFNYFIENIPDDADTYHGMIYVGSIENNRITSLFSAMTLYIVFARFYDFFLSLPESCHVDRELGLTAHIHKYMVCPEFVCFQDGSKSDSTFSTCDYSSYLIGRKIFGQ
jgi:hypothetical protein